MDEKNVKITKLSHAYKDTYRDKIFNSFNPELQHEDTEAAIKNKK